VNVKLRDLADLVKGTLVGDGELQINAARPLDLAQRGEITFVEDEKHAHLLPGSQASAAVVPSSFPMEAWFKKGSGTVERSTLRVVPATVPDPFLNLSYIQVPDPLNAFVLIVRHLQGNSEPPPHGIDPRSFVDPSVVIGEQPSVYPFASVGEGTVIGARGRILNGVVIGRHCRLGDDVTIYPNVVLYDRTVLGNRVRVHANSVIGADGFGYRLQNGRHSKVPQLGYVEIGDDVEIGACTTIDRGTFRATRIGEGTKIDNLVQIGHNCNVGRHNLFVSQMGMAGSSSTGDFVVLAGQVGVVDHVHIGDRTVVGGKAAVTKDVPEGQRLLGAPATPEREQKRMLMSLEKLPEIRRDVRRILQHLGLEQGSNANGSH
jgi:UDP-3-O-[3-hydroxymyristoyl] glucosamine N-acyltransferase